MAENLFLRLGEEQGLVTIEWMLLDETSGIVRFRGEGPVEEFTELASELDLSGSTYVMLKGEEVLLTQATIPSKQQRQVLQAVPFMVEENLATDIDACHFAVGGRDESGDVSVAVIDRDRMEFWLACLADAGVKPQHLTVDTLSVPFQKGSTVFLDEDRALFRTGEFRGFSIQSNLLATSVGLLSDDEKENVTLMVHESARETTELDIARINAEQENAVTVADLEYWPFETLCRGFDKKAINLLQGEFKIETPKSSRGATWKSVAILAACAFGLQIAVVLGQGIYLDIKANELLSESRTLYKGIFPGDRNVRDNEIKRRWDLHLGKSGNSDRKDGFLSLFSETAKHLPASSLVLSNVTFSESRGDLILQLETSKSDQLIIDFRDTLIKLGITAEIGTIQGVDPVKGSIKVKSLGRS
jgi:general secretion pathway protein L